jgi:flagellar biosynthesis chaperone FliJ
MKSFRFRLEKVLEWYTRQYELEERRLAVCLAAVEETKQAIAALLAERVSIERDLLARKAIPAQEFAALGLYRLGVRKREIDLNDVRGRREAEADAQRAKVQAAKRRVSLLEKLRERRLAEYSYAETRELEELASDAFFAKWAAR